MDIFLLLDTESNGVLDQEQIQVLFEEDVMKKCSITVLKLIYDDEEKGEVKKMYWKFDDFTELIVKITDDGEEGNGQEIQTRKNLRYNLYQHRTRCKGCIYDLCAKHICFRLRKFFINKRVKAYRNTQKAINKKK